MLRWVVLAAVSAALTLAPPGTAALYSSLSVSHTPAQPAATGPVSMALSFSGDRVAARATFYVPLGYELTLPAMQGGVIGTASASATVAGARASTYGPVTVDALSNWPSHPCLPFEQGGFLRAVLVASVPLAGQTIRLPLFITVPNRGSNLGNVTLARMELCFPAPVGPSNQGVATGVSFQYLLIQLRGILRAPAAGNYLWYSHAIPFRPGTGVLASDSEAIESRARIFFPAGVNFSARRSGGRRVLGQGRVTEASTPIAGVSVDVFDGRRQVAKATTNTAGAFAVNVRLTKGRHTLRAVAGVLSRVPAPACADTSPFAQFWPFVPFWERGRPCVSELLPFYTLESRTAVRVP